MTKSEYWDYCESICNGEDVYYCYGVELILEELGILHL